MDPIGLFAVTAVGLILFSIPVMIIVSAKRERERSRYLQHFAAEHGWTYTAREDLPADLKSNYLFQSGTQGLGFGRKIKNVLRGSVRGATVLVFDYWYTRVAGVSGIRQTNRATVVCSRRNSSEPWTMVYEEGLGYLDVQSVPDLIDRALKAPASE